MDYNELAYLAKQKKISITSLASQMEMSRQGLQSGVNNQSFTGKKILKLCELVGISPNELLGWETAPVPVSGNYASHVSGSNTQNSNETIAALSEQLKEKDRQIDRLLKIVEKMEKK